MPVVPVATPQVEINPSAPRFESGGSQESATAGGRQIAATGDALLRAGQGFGAIVAKEQERVNKVRLNDAYNQATEIAAKLKYDPEEGYLKYKGAAAAKGIDNQPLADHYQSKLKAKVADIAATLDNPFLQSQFGMLSADLDANFHKEAMAYEGEQTNVYALQVQDATIVTSGNLIAKDPANAPVVDFHTARARDAAIQKGKDAGLAGDALDNATKATMGVMHNAVIDSLLNSAQPKLAQAYFKTHEADYTTLDAQAVAAKLKGASDAAAAVDAVDSVWAKSGPKGLNAPLNKAEMDKALRVQFKDDPAMLKTARAELSIRANDWEAQETERNDANVNSILARLAKGESLANLKSTPAWLAIEGSKQDSITRMVVERGRSDKANVVDDMSDEVFAGYLELSSDPAKLASMSPDSIMAMLPTYGRTVTVQLLNQQKSLQKEGAMAAAVIDQQDFDVLARQMGLSPYKKFDKLSEKERANLGALKYRIETRIAQEQAAAKRPLTRPEKQELMKFEMSQKVLVDKPATWTDWAPKDFNSPVIMLSPADVANVVVPPEEVPLIVAALQQQKIAPTKENIKKRYLMRFPSGQFAVDE